MSKTHDYFLDRERCISEHEARPEPSDYEPEPPRRRIPKYNEEGLHESAYEED